MSHLVRQQDLPISSYALLGDGRTTALVAQDGSVDWMCLGRFDGPAVFCRLLDAARGGFLQVAPSEAFRSTRAYLDRSNVLVSEFECASGRVRLTDFMPSSTERPALLRRVEAVSGEVDVVVHFEPTFDFTRAASEIELRGDGCSARAEGAHLRLRCPSPLHRTERGARGVLRLRAGGPRWVVLTEGDAEIDDGAAERALKATEETWGDWYGRGRYWGPYAEQLWRSAAVLRMLIHAPTGATVAAPTTSLPEAPAGVRNWDYRFTWLRDASWTVSALMELGYHDESMRFIDWLAALDLGGGRGSVFYDLGGQLPRREMEVPELRGWGGARPVRVGNAAAGQDQHDVFGEVVAAIHACWSSMPSMHPLRGELWRLVCSLADGAADHWTHPDRGLWEMRSRPRAFLSSRLLCWTALDRALSIARTDGLAAPVKRWRATRGAIRAAIERDNFDPGIGAFTLSPASAAADASALLLPRYGFLDACDPRMLSTVDWIRRRLTVGRGLLMRYDVSDGLPGREGAFVACSFWLVDCLARQGRVEQARACFEEVLRYSSDLGLFSEEVDPRSGDLLGNYPQALSHLALIRAAHAIEAAESAR